MRRLAISLFVALLTMAFLACSVADSAREISATAVAEGREQLEAAPRPVITFEHPAQPTPAPGAPPAARAPVIPEASASAQVSTEASTATPSMEPIRDPTLIPVSIPTETSTSTPAPTLTITPIPSPTPTITPTPTPRPTSTPTPTQTTPPWQMPLDVELIEHWIIVFTNEERERHGRRPLEHSPAISDIARAHSENMVAQGIFAHRLDGKNPTGRSQSAGYECRYYFPDGRYTYTSGLAENIAKNYRVKGWSGVSRGYGRTWVPRSYELNETETARNLVDQWMGSSGHRANILDARFHRIGVGVAMEWDTEYGGRAELFWATQNFSLCR